MIKMPKQVKVDNWGVFFLQRLKHFFNRTDYCDLTLQFQDNAQLKVHRLVLSACTEYFELLERTCEMYEDCLVMPDDLQADVVVPIVNFMYTGQLEFRMDILERLHATSEIMNMPVLTKLLDSHRPRNRGGLNYSKHHHEPPSVVSIKMPTVEIVSAAPKRSFAKAFDKNSQNVAKLEKKHIHPLSKPAVSVNVANGGAVYRPSSPRPIESLVRAKQQKFVTSEPRPTRYELPEELDTDNIFENSFCNISYTSQPLMVHPETTKKYAKRPRQDKSQASSSKKSRSSILNIVECKKIEKAREEHFYDESDSVMADDAEMFKPAYLNAANVKTEPAKDPNKLFDQLLDQNEESAKVTIETTKNNKAGANLDHAKIISEVLKKYPHLVKSNKNIKLKIFNNPTSKGANKKQKASPQPAIDKSQNVKPESLSDFTYETDVLDSKQAARLIALGAENVEGPWICLICGTPGKALHFTSYYKFRRHLVDVHNEKPVLNICEYCGQRMCKRNHLLHHMYTKHGVEPPSSHNFPKCSQCNYIALTEALLVKHKLSHSENKSFRCNVCPSSFTTSNLLLSHIQNTGHKYIADRKHNHQCIYCLRVFVRENNLYAHLKTHHKTDAIRDGIIDESDDDNKAEPVKAVVKHEAALNDYDDNHLEYHIEQKADGNIQLIQKKHKTEATQLKQKILNSGLTSEPPKAPTPKSKASKTVQNIETEENQDENISTFNENNEEIVVIDNNEYIMSGNRLILRDSTKEPSEEYILSDMIDEKSAESPQSSPTTSMDYATILNSNENMQQATIMLKDAGNLTESIPIYVSNEEEYKALMSSNHNIIFDSGDSNKTLTVLTAPDADALNNTRINLENSQDNGIRVIREDPYPIGVTEAVTLDNARIDLHNSQNDGLTLIREDTYPLGVTEAVTTDNSSIVVVYSHQVGDPNKEYQLLTTQALGPQYAQTSAILTQNYDTVSTSSPVMSAHILDSQVAVWQGDIQQNIDREQTEVAVLETIVHAEEVESTNAPDSIEDISDLPQVQLTPETDSFNQSENINSGLEPELIESSENMPMEVDAPLVTPIEENIENVEIVKVISENIEKEQEVVEETEVLKQSDSSKIEDIPIPENAGAEQQPEVISMDGQSSDTNENIIGMDNSNSNNNSNIVSSDIQSSDTNENIENFGNQSDNLKETVEMIIQEPVSETANLANTDQPFYSENELIQTLPSEWQENNVETILQDSTEDAEKHIEGEEVEESVENIQQEIKKQMLLTEDQIYTEKEVSAVNKSETSNVEPRVKISSLLNDWDDNDESQDDNVMVEKLSTEPVKEIDNSDAQNLDTHSHEQIPDSEQEIISKNVSSITVDNETLAVPDYDLSENTQTDPETNLCPENEIVAKKDNIKSLVSDWDDDDDDNKE